LIWRARRSGPSGIDRVELAYAQHFLAEGAPRPAYAVVHLLGFLLGVNPTAARRFVEAAATRWKGGVRGAESGHAFGLLALYSKLFMGGWMAGFQLRRRLRRHQGPPIFMVVSHYHLSDETRIRRIQRDFGARFVCFLHDLIPIDYPEYVQTGKERQHRRVTETIVRCFDAMIVNSHATADSFRRFAASMSPASARAPSIHVAPLGACAFPCTEAESKLPQKPDSVPYFVVLGTIEPKKNHLLLLNLWARLAETFPKPPRLLIIGARGWENEQAVDMLERSRRLRGLVEEHNHLDDAAIGALLAGARALLVPSFVEGFGLPLAEGLASAVPVICSDIPAFREVGREVPDYLDPLDLFAWRDAVVDYARADCARRRAQNARHAGWRAPLWSEHFEIVERALGEVSELSGAPQ
jgi:glycosyltransferase involved in cell wall biosynthesis